MRTMKLSAYNVNRHGSWEQAAPLGAVYREELSLLVATLPRHEVASIVIPIVRVVERCLGEERALSMNLEIDGEPGTPFSTHKTASAVWDEPLPAADGPSEDSRAQHSNYLTEGYRDAARVIMYGVQTAWFRMKIDPERYAPGGPKRKSYDMGWDLAMKDLDPRSADREDR